MQPVQSAITIMSFPRSFADNQDAIEKVEDWLADFDTLFDFTSNNEDPIYWTAPRWTMEGDVLFFYLTKSSKDNIRRLARRVDEESLAYRILAETLGWSTRAKAQISLKPGRHVVRKALGYGFCLRESHRSHQVHSAGERVFSTL